MLDALQPYLHQFTRLKQGVTPYGKAPHKPVLIITLLELISKGHIAGNRVVVEPELVGTFQENWRLLVTTLHQPDFTQPFYYLQSERVKGLPFWQLQPKTGCQINAHIKSVNTLISVLDYGFFADDLFILLSDTFNRNRLLAALLDTYFPIHKAQYYQSKSTGQGYLTDLEHYVLNEPEAQYKNIQIVTEEEEYVRGGLFKKLVPKVYRNACCITGMRLESTFGHLFVDACHIVPFRISHNDRVDNGLALCPNLHRAFDRGLISIDKQYRVITSPHISENTLHPYSLGQLHGKSLQLPANPQYRPALEHLDWHRDNVFKG
jgi:putative restriction endonuclease